jgi:hypothetical protein
MGLLIGAAHSLVAATYQNVRLCGTRWLHATTQDSPGRSSEWAGNKRARWSLAHRHSFKKTAVGELLNALLAVTGSHIHSLPRPVLSCPVPVPNPAAVMFYVIFLLFLHTRTSYVTVLQHFEPLYVLVAPYASHY